MRTRMESYLSAGLREAGMVSGDYALVSLLTVEGQLTPAMLARLVGVALSTLGPRLNSLTDRGWVERRANPANRRSWLLQLTPAGWAAYHAAVPYAKVAFDRLDRAPPGTTGRPCQPPSTDPDLVHNPAIAAAQPLM
jgi:DNA-binding MarR family transcriptional regulator